MRLERSATVEDWVTVELWTGWRSSKILEIRHTLAGPYVLAETKVPRSKGVLLWTEIVRLARRRCEDKTGRFAVWSTKIYGSPRKRPGSTI